MMSYFVPGSLLLLGCLCAGLAYLLFHMRRKLWRAPGVILALLSPILLAGTYTGLPIVLNNTQLKLLPSWQYFSVLRMGVTTVGDAPPLWFNPSSTACTISGGDVGSQNPSYDGGCFNATYPVGYLDPREWGADSTGSADSTTALQAAVNYGATNGKGIFIGSPYLISGSIGLPPGSNVQGVGMTACINMGGSGGYAALITVDAAGHTYPRAAMPYGAFSIKNICVQMNGKSGDGILIDGTRGATIADNVVLNGATTGTWPCLDDYGVGTCPNAEIGVKGNSHDNAERNYVVNNAGLGSGYFAAFSSCATYSGIGLWVGTSSGDTAHTNPPNYNYFGNSTTYCNSNGVQYDYGSDNIFDGGDYDFAQNNGFVVGVTGASRTAQASTIIKPGLENAGACGINLSNAAAEIRIEDINSVAGTTTAICGPSTSSFQTLQGIRWLFNSNKSNDFSVPAYGGQYNVSTSANTVNATMSATPIIGAVLDITDVGGAFATNNLTVTGNGNNVNGGATAVFSTNYSHICLWFTGTKWVNGRCGG
jgi:hypothetical protein